MNTFANIADFIATAPAAVWVDSDCVSGFTYHSEADMYADNGVRHVTGVESFSIDIKHDYKGPCMLIDALIEAGIAYESN